MVALMTVFTALSYVPAKAATVVPKVQFVGEQAKEFTAGERVTFNLNASNYGGRVQYRVVLWNDSTKSYGDLWNTADKYYTNWMPYGNETLPLGWVINEPGTYRITVYAKRAGLANSKTALKGMNCDSYLNGPAFVVKPKAATPESIAPVADVTVNEGEKAVLPTEVTLNLSDKTTKTAKVTWAAVDTTKVGTVAIEGTVEGTSLKAKVNVVVKAVALSAEVSALNLKEIEVKFNKAVDVTEENFMINGTTVDEDSFALSEDGKVATLYNVASPKAGQTVKVAIVNVNGLATTLKDVIVNDNALPTVTSVQAVGNKLVKINFSEPISVGNTSMTNFKIGGYIKSGSLTTSNFNKTVSIELTTALADGSYDLEVNATNVKDFAGYALGINKTSFSVAKDAAVPGYTVVSATQQAIRVKFDKEVKSSGADMTLYWKENSTEHKATGSQSAVDPKVWTFKFSAADRLPAGDNALMIKKVVDFSGNIKTDYEVKVSAVIDNVRPAYESYVQKDASTFEFKFSKSVTANRANYTFTDKEGVNVAVSTATIKATDPTVVVVVTASPLNTLRNPYIVKIKDVIDTTYLANKAEDAIISVTVADITAPTIVGTAVLSGNTYSVTFNEDIDQSSILLQNFKYAHGGAIYYEIPSAAYYQVVGTRTINITFPAKFGPLDAHRASTISALYLSDVKDLAGNKMIATSIGKTGSLGSVAKANGPYMIDNKTIVIEPQHALQNIYSSDFVVKAGTKELEIDKAELVIADTDVNKLALQILKGNPLTGITAGVQVIKITLKDAVDANAQAKVDGVPTAITVATVADVQLTKDALDVPFAMTATTVTDKVIPTAPVASNYTLTKTVTGAAFDLTTSFIADENVTVEYLVQDNDVTPVTIDTVKTADDVAVATNMFDASVAANGKAFVATAGQEVYVRFVDSSLNKTAWVKLGTIIPDTVIASFVFTVGSTTDGTLSGLTASTQEYSIDGGTTWTTTTAVTEALVNVSAANDIKVRVKEAGTVPAGAIQTINILAVPAAPTVVATSTTELAGTTTAMEYSTNNGTSWTPATLTNTTLVGTTTGQIVQIRVKATAAGTNNIAPEGAITSIVLP